MEQHAAPNINILSFQSHDQNSLGSFLSWSLKYGRIIVIVTEFLVIAAFISRFYFDRQLSDLHDHIELNTAVVEGMQGTEKEFLLLKQTLQNVQTTLSNQKDFSKLMASINEQKPSDLTIREFSMRDTELTFTAQVSSPVSLNTFITNMATTNKFSDFAIDDLALKDGQLVMTARANVKAEAYK